MSGVLADELLQPSNTATTKKMFKTISMENGRTTTEIDQEHLRDIVDSKNLGKMPVSIVSVAGPFREGKSFLLNILRQYLLSLRDEQNRTGNWDVRPPPLKPEATFPEGFLSKGGVDGVTSGIDILAEPIVVNTERGDVAVILMDTEGSFDPMRDRTEKQNGLHKDGLIFALSVLLSDTQIFNTKGHLKETTLDEVAMFLLYGFMANDRETPPDGNIQQSPFHRLVFCLRDFGTIDDINGEEYLQNVLSKREDVREKLSCYQELSCHLLPHPGNTVVRNKESFRGLVRDVDEDFMELAWSMAASLFDPHSLRAKEVLGGVLTCDQLPQLAAGCWKALHTKVVPMQTYTEAYATVKFMREKETAFRNYRQEMHNRMTTRYDRNLNNVHTDCKNRALSEFDSAVQTVRHGFDYQKTPMRQNLENDIEEEWQLYSASNKNKRNVLDKMEDGLRTAYGTINTVVRNPYVQTVAGVVAVVGGFGTVVAYFGAAQIASTLVVVFTYLRHVPV